MVLMRRGNVQLCNRKSSLCVLQLGRLDESPAVGGIDSVTSAYVGSDRSKAEGPMVNKHQKV